MKQYIPFLFLILMVFCVFMIMYKSFVYIMVLILLIHTINESKELRNFFYPLVNKYYKKLIKI